MGNQDENFCLIYYMEKVSWKVRLHYSSVQIVNTFVLLFLNFLSGVFCFVVFFFTSLLP